MDLNKITSPTLLLDKNICLKNIKSMVEKAKLNNVIFRPHFKTHQSIVISNWFRKSGVDKITVSSIHMAEYFARENWKDITVAFSVNIREIDRINDLAEETQLNLTIENKESIEFLEKTLKYPVKVFIKIDTGYHRTGVDYSDINNIDLILNIARNSKLLYFAGFLSHFGHTYNAYNKNDIQKIFDDSISKLKALKNKYIQEYSDLIVSVGDTPSCSLLNDFGCADEIRPGNFVFYDLMQYKLGSCKLDQIAVCMACPVVAIHKQRNEIVIHGGAVHFSKENIKIDGVSTYGQLVILNKNGWLKPEKDYFLVKLSQEHGTIIADDELIKSIRVGDLIGIIPVHSCLTSNLMRSYLTTDNDWLDHLSGND